MKFVCPKNYAILLLALIALVGEARAQQPLQISLALKPGKQMLGMPINFNITVSNISDKPVPITFYLDPAVGDLSVSISTDNLHFHGYLGPGWDVFDISPRRLILGPGREDEATFSVFVNRAGLRPIAAPLLAFPSAGTYFLKATVNTEFGSLTSNTVRVLVQQPQGKDVAVWDVIRNDTKLAGFIQNPGWADYASNHEDEKAQQLLKKYPNSIYASLLTKALDKFNKYMQMKAGAHRKTDSAPN